MQVCIHRGAREIGGSCVEIISSDNKRIIIDLGLPLDAENNDSSYLPSVKGLDGSDPSLLALIISHPHLDHFGLASYVSSKIPVIIGTYARKIIESASMFLSGAWKIPASGRDLKDRSAVNIGPFKITPFLIDHSGFDSYCLLIESDKKRLFYSGDLRMHGRKAKLTKYLISNPPGNIDVLMLEGSMLSRAEGNRAFPSEDFIEDKLAEMFKAAKGITLVHASAQNIDRVVSIFKACKRTGKKLLIDLYAALILEATGNDHIPKSYWPEVRLFVPQWQRLKIKNNEWFDLLKKHSRNRIFIEKIQEMPSDYVLLFRPLHINDIEKAGLTKDAAYVYSQWEGYWEKDNYSFLRKWIKKYDIPKISMHTSGHADVDVLKQFAKALNPGKIVPIHTFVPEKYSQIYNNVELHDDGQYWEV